MLDTTNKPGTDSSGEKLYNWIIDLFRNYLAIPKGDEVYRSLILLADTEGKSGKSTLRRIIRFQLGIANYLSLREMSDDK